jgi:hypothetical protein
MQTIDLEKSIKDFLALGRQLQSLQPLIAEKVLGEFFAWYREDRITGASLIENEDMLLLQWGVIRPLNILEPTDLRGIGDEEITYSNSRFQYLNFTRQVFPSGGNKDVEFDDVAIQMSITLCYGSTVEKENSDSLWIESPNDLEHGEENFRSIPFVDLLLKTPVSRVEIIAQHCG